MSSLHTIVTLSSENLAANSTVALFNVGANKGYAIASMLQRFGLMHGNTTDWHQALRSEIKKTPNGKLIFNEQTSFSLDFRTSGKH